jgi:glycosyltransferase involved in cell wall biosynthesis
MIISTTLTGGARADVIGASLATIAPEVDLCLVIDTGATDDSMKIAADVLGSKLIAVSWPWRNDFGAARNFALQAGKDAINALKPIEPSDWILTADTDEWPRYPGAREWLATVPAHADVVMISHHSRTYRQTRAFRATTKAVWR